MDSYYKNFIENQIHLSRDFFFNNCPDATELNFLNTILQKEMIALNDYKRFKNPEPLDNQVYGHERVIEYLLAEIKKLERKERDLSNRVVERSFVWISTSSKLEILYKHLIDFQFVGETSLDNFKMAFTPLSERQGSFKKLSWEKGATLFTYFIYDLLTEKKLIRRVSRIWECSNATFEIKSKNLRKLFNNRNDTLIPRGGEELKKIIDSITEK